MKKLFAALAFMSIASTSFADGYTCKCVNNADGDIVLQILSTQKRFLSRAPVVQDEFLFTEFQDRQANFNACDEAKKYDERCAATVCESYKRGYGEGRSEGYNEGYERARSNYSTGGGGGGCG